MIKVIAVTLTAFAAVTVSNVSTFANEAARQKCCIEMGGQYVALAQRGGNRVCTGISRASADAYYKCVERGGRSAKH
jgi:hypothetical protein